MVATHGCRSRGTTAATCSSSGNFGNSICSTPTRSHWSMEASSTINMLERHVRCNSSPHPGIFPHSCNFQFPLIAFVTIEPDIARLQHISPTSTCQCMQWKNLAVSPPLTPMSEDCLRLNVFTPASSTPEEGSELLPIFFWLYGGDNTMGSTAFYGPVENLVTHYGGKAIVVTSNFRVGNFGFLALKELSAEDPRGVSGNLAILDIQLALQWVQTNAAAFGGDKSKVTLIGQSSGGTNIFGLFASPGSKGLFSAAISLSGSPNITQTLASAEIQDREFVQNVGCDKAPNVLDCLYSLSAKEVAAKSPDAWDFGGASIPPAGSTPETQPSRDGLVIVDGVTITQPLLETMSSGMINVPLIVQTMQAETDYAPSRAVADWSAVNFSNFITTSFASWGRGAATAINSMYSNVSQKSGTLAYYTLDADIGITCGSAAVATAAVKRGSYHTQPVYLSQVLQVPDHPYPFVPGIKSVYPFHMFDFICGFGTWGLPYVPGEKYTPGPNDLALGKILRTAWYELATTGRITTAPWAPVSNAISPITVLLRVESPVATVNWKTDTCTELDRLGLGKRYWWVN
eukprot:m.351907 g.351907  ORF g.351907 m.351907 type:complete len:573 (-) comp16580_c1_seq1:501-2219(-)